MGFVLALADDASAAAFHVLDGGVLLMAGFGVLAGSAGVIGIVAKAMGPAVDHVFGELGAGRDWLFLLVLLGGDFGGCIGGVSCAAGSALA